MHTLAKAATSLLTAGSAAVTLSAGTAHATPSATTFLGTFHLTRTDFAGDVGATDLACFTVQAGDEAPTVLGAGAVTDPDAACRELAAAEGDPALLLVHPTWLTSDLVAPVTVGVSGSWGPADVSWSHTYLNGSQLAKYTGDVFGF